jgi:hypothetical protein
VRRVAVAALLAAGVSGCSTAYLRTNVLDARVDERHAASYLGLPLKSGQLVLTEAPGATSFVIILIPARFYRFTHAAILSMENGQPFVYEISGRVARFPLHEKLLDNVRGEMHRRSLLEHVSLNLYAEIYDVPAGVSGEKVVEYAKQQFAAQTAFDPFFDYSDHKKLFCTELIELALEHGGMKPRLLDPVNDNESLRIAMRWLGVPMNTVLPAGAYADPDRYVGALGQFPTRTAADGYFEAKREVYRRFTNDQRLGYLFELDGWGQIDMRPEVHQFAIDASHLFDAVHDPPPPGDPRVAAAVRHLADERFGPLGR